MTPLPGKFTSADGTISHVHSWADVAAFYRRFAREPAPAGSGLATLTPLWDGGWSGGTREDVLRMLDQGYDFPAEYAQDFPVSVDGSGPRWRWNDEDGDYEHELFLAGEADYYLDRRLEPGKPGVYVHCELWFTSATTNETLAAYGQWVGAAVRAIQAMGYDVALRVTSTANGIWSGPGLNPSQRHQTAIQVTRFGEQLLARDFSALFTEPGLRHLIFGAMSIPEIEYPKVQTNSSYGTLIRGQGWGVEWDEDARVLSFTCQSHGAEFPAEDMTAMLKEATERL